MPDLSGGEQLRSPSGEYTVTLKGVRGRALTPAFKHNVKADVVKTGAGDIIHVWLSEEDSLDQPFTTQYSSTAWPQPNILKFHGSLADQSWNDELVIENQDDSVLPCLKVFTISNYDLIVAFDIKGKSHTSLEWKPDSKAATIHFMAARCETPGRTPTVYKTFPRSPQSRQSYRVVLASGQLQLDVTPRKRPS